MQTKRAGVPVRKKRVSPRPSTVWLVVWLGKAAGFLVILKCMPRRWQWVSTGSSFKCAIYSNAYGAPPGWCFSVPRASPIYLLDSRAYTTFRIPAFRNVQDLPIRFSLSCLGLESFQRCSCNFGCECSVPTKEKKVSELAFLFQLLKQVATVQCLSSDAQRMLLLPFCTCRIALVFRGGS